MDHTQKPDYDMSTQLGRLEAAAAFMRRVHAEGLRLNMGNWLQCALGRMAREPEFRAAGLGTWFGVPKYDGLTKYRAGAAFFGLTTSGSMLVFAPRKVYTLGQKETALDVAYRLDYLANEARARTR